jgi:CheY-like chemotaxis protein
MLDRTRFTDAGRAIAHHPVVLIVEDEPLLRYTTAEFLRLSGYGVIEARSAAEAVAQFDSGKSIDFVFSDVFASGSADGLSLAQWLRDQHPEVPVILTTGYGKALRDAAIEIVGSDSFLPKPYSPNELMRRIRSTIR